MVRFEMHDHIRDKGRKIIQDEGFYQGSRLWEDDMSLDILQNKKVKSTLCTTRQKISCQ